MSNPDPWFKNDEEKLDFEEGLFRLTILEKIATLMHEQNVDYQELANRMGVPAKPETIKSIMNDNAPLTIGVLYQIFHYLGHKPLITPVKYIAELDYESNP